MLPRITGFYVRVGSEGTDSLVGKKWGSSFDPRNLGLFCFVSEESTSSYHPSLLGREGSRSNWWKSFSLVFLNISNFHSTSKAVGWGGFWHWSLFLISLLSQNQFLAFWVMTPKVLWEKSLFWCAYAMETIGLSPHISHQESVQCCWAVTNGLIDYHLTNSSSFSVWQMFDNCTVATLLPSPLHQTLYSGWGTESQNSLELEGAHKDDWIQLFSEWPIQGLNLQPCCYLYHSLTIWANLRVTWK